MRFLIVFLCLLAACNSDESAEQSRSTTIDIKDTGFVAEKAALPDLPSSVVYKNWVPGDPQHTRLITDIYKAWDSENTEDLKGYFADSALLELPDSKRLWVTSETAETRLRAWRSIFKTTDNMPFSVMSMRNADYNEEWIMTWVWNRWSYNDGKKDSMLFCDNWRVHNGKVIYMYSLQHKPSKQLSRTLNNMIPQ